MQPTASRSADIAAAVAGAIAAAVTIGAAELIAAFVSGAPSLVIAIGDLVIDLQPPGAKDLMVSLFGDSDKLVLNLVIVAGAVLIAAAVGVAARRRWAWGVIGFLVAGGVAALAALRQPLTDRVLAVVTVAVAVAMGLVVLRWLLSFTRPAWATGTAGSAAAAAAAMPDWDRRGFLIAGGAATAGALVAGALGRTLLEGRAAGPTVADVLPPTAGGSPRPVPSLPAGSELDVPGITPLVVPNDRFYRIDTALLVPRVDASTWSLTVKGMVDREVRLTYEDLRAMPLFDQYVTIACVSNEVGGNLVGNALWTGVHLREVLAMAGVQTGATQIVGRSVDGFTVGFPTEWAMDPARDPMIAIGMNGEPLPADHGYPARLIIPGLFGYVSATKWLGSIELTTWEGYDAYWVPLGWSKEGPILTQARIDVPGSGARVTAGPVSIAGVAWAPDRGVERVEVKVDDEDWVMATMSAPLSDATWVQWLRVWDATPGRHTILVRATDGAGEVQTADITSPAPDGARGHHTIEVEVTEPEPSAA
ncbi:MAG: molybdopterin-dependent oxidoreductase [Candidatus Limnocylindrales bacterium]